MKRLTLEERVKRLEKAQGTLDFTPPPTRKPIWRDRHDTPIFADEMDDQYLLNTIDLIIAIHNKQDFLPLLKAEARRRGLM